MRYRFSAGQKAFGIDGTNNTVKCGEGELEYFRHTLLYNSVRTAPSRYLAALATASALPWTF